MDLRSPPNLSDEDRTWYLLESQIRECYGRVVYSHKAHEKNADLYFSRLRKTKLAQIILSAITTGGIFGVLFADGSEVIGILTAGTATLQFFLNTYIKEYSLSETAERHTATASKLWAIRESYLALLTDIISRTTNLEEALTRRERLQQDLAAIYEKAPRTLSSAYKAAQRALKLNEELTFSDDEINAFLPTSLRRSPPTP